MDGVRNVTARDEAPSDDVQQYPVPILGRRLPGEGNVRTARAIRGDRYLWSDQGCGGLARAGRDGRGRDGVVVAEVHVQRQCLARDIGRQRKRVVVSSLRTDRDRYWCCAADYDGPCGWFDQQLCLGVGKHRSSFGRPTQRSALRTSVHR